MAKFNIPIIDQPRQSLGTIIGGQSVIIRLHWQPYDAHWYIGMRFRDGRSIIEGVRIITGANLADGAREGFIGKLEVEGIDDPGRFAWRDETHRLIYDNQV